MGLLKKQSKIRSFLLVAISCVLAMHLSACGNNVKREAEIAAELPMEYRELVVDGVRTVLDVDSLTIEKRQTNKKEKEDIVYCTVTSKNKDYTSFVPLRLVYTYYDKGGWILEKNSLQSVSEPLVVPTDGIPHKVSDAYIAGYYPTYTPGEKQIYADGGLSVSYEVEGITEMQGIPALKYGGTVELFGRFINTGSWNEYRWELTPSCHLKPLEGISKETAEVLATTLYQTAQYQSEEFNAEAGIHQYLFSISEIHENCSANGDLMLRYRFLQEDGNLYPKWQVEIDRNSLVTKWMLGGTWRAEFLHKGEHYVSRYPLSFSIRAVDDTTVTFSDGKCSTYMDGGFGKEGFYGENRFKHSTATYEVWEDGTLSFPIDFGYGELTVSVSPDGATVRWPWLYYAEATLTKQD